VGGVKTNRKGKDFLAPYSVFTVELAWGWDYEDSFLLLVTIVKRFRSKKHPVFDKLLTVLEDK